MGSGRERIDPSIITESSSRQLLVYGVDFCMNREEKRKAQTAPASPRFLDKLQLLALQQQIEA